MQLIFSFFKSQLIKDSVWSLVGNVFSKGLSLLSGIVIARFLGKDIFGEYGMIKNTLISLALFSTFGLGYTVTKFIAEYKEKYKMKVDDIIYYTTIMVLFISFSIALIVFCFSDFIARELLDSIHLSTSVRIMSGLIVLNAIVALQIGVLSGLGKFRKMAKINIIIGFSTILISTFLTYFFGLNGALLSLGCIQLITIMLNTNIIGEHKIMFGNRAKIDNQILRKIITFSLPVAFQEGVFSFTYWLSSLLIIRYSSYGELGLYTATAQWTSLILFIPGVLRNVILSHLSKNNNNSVEFNKTIKTTLVINFVMTLIPVLIVVMFSRVISEFYGTSFSNFSSLINVAVFSTLFISISNVYMQIYMSKNKNWLMFAFRSCRDFSVIIIFFVLINYINSGAKTMIYSVLISNIFFLLLVTTVYKLKIQET